MGGSFLLEELRKKKKKKCLVVQLQCVQCCMMGTSLPKEERLEDKIFPKESVRPNQTSSVFTCPDKQDQNIKLTKEQRET